MPSEKKKRVLPPLPTGLDFNTPPKDSLVEDLRYALEHAKELYSDIAWDFTVALNQTNIYAHKAILYARSSRSFQERFLKNKDANGMSIRSVRLSNPEPIIVKTAEDPFFFRQELRFFYTGEEGSEEFLAAVDTTDELEQDKLKEDLLYMLKSKLYTDVELVLDRSDDILDIIEEDEEIKPITVRAHRFMLYTRSEYFKKMFSSNFIEARSSHVHLDNSIFTQTSLNLILTFIYTGNLSSPSKPLTLETCELVWIGADFLGIKLLCDECIYRIADKLHHFTCTCAECQAVVPGVAAFAKQYEVDILWQGCLHVLSHGFDKMWPQKAFAELDEDTREEILLTVLSRIQNNNIMAIFKSCRKVLSMIEIKGIGLPWIETIREMTMQVQLYTTQILVENFEQLCDDDQEFLDCVDGIGFSSDLLEDMMYTIIEEGLSERNAARVLKCITEKLLTRQAIMNTESFETKRVLIQAKQKIFDYIKKRWISVKQNGGFRILSPWLLDEFSKELGVTNQELQELADHKDTKPKVRTPSITNGLSKKSREPSPSPTPKVVKSIVTPPEIVTTPPHSNTPIISTNTTTVSTNTTTVLTNSTTVSTNATTISTEDTDTLTTNVSPSSEPASNGNGLSHSTSNSSLSSVNSSSQSSPLAESSSDTTSKTKVTTSNVTKKGKNVRIGGTTTAPVWARPTRASVLRQKALADLRVPNGSSTSQRGRSSAKQNASAASSRASSISSVKSLTSPSVSPSRFSGVRQTRSSLLRKLKYDDAEQRRGRDTERDTSPTSSRASSIASVSSITSNTTTSSHHRRKRSPSQNSSSTSITSNSSAITSLQPKPHQTKLATIPNPDISVGRRIILPTKNNAPGAIQFLGETEFAKGIWVGIVLDNPVGKNNGVVANTKYFTAGPNHGIFVRPDSLLLI
ncbi:8865_t:CDS:2 [Funneliformis mosseae]|uniref:8865_t:CDS:1 n=1 Tax=Funneliformis mosseae TaxID=27381 RepID=A0A9N9BEC7_FUNMO|nr:8865_t:CDS:2 [Funneliformis mosseae]